MHSRVLKVSLLVLLLLPLIEWLRPLSADPLKAGKILENRFWTYKARHRQVYDMVILGDSRTYRGLSPSAMQQELTGLKILNFGYSSLGFSQPMLKETEERLSPQAKNKILLLGITPYSLTLKAQANEHFLQEKNRKPEEVWQNLYTDPAYDLFSKKLHALLPFCFFNPSQPAQLYYQEFHDDGWIGSWTTPENPSEALNIYRHQFENNLVDQQTLAGLFNQVSQWQKKNIQVFALRPPTSMPMLELENQLSGFDESQFVADFTAAGGRWLDFSPTAFHSYDGSHLERQSALKLSQQVAQKIQILLNKP